MDMVERVARAMAPMFADANSYWCNGTEWPNCPPDTCQCRKMAFDAARAAIATMREPTKDMIADGFDAVNVIDVGYEEVVDGWRAMIDAALTSSGPPK